MKKDTISIQYNRFHDKYSELLSEQNEISNQAFHNAIDFELKGKRVLDIGCGDGSALRILADKGARAYGIDPSASFIKAASLNVPNGTFAQGVGERLPYADHTFDVVVSKWAIQTSSNVPQILFEAARVLQSGGMLVVLTKHPIMQWLEKVRDYGHGSNYYEQKIVTSKIYDGSITLKEPSHTLSEYFNDDFFSKFEMVSYKEATEFPASEQFDGDTYPTFLVMKAKRK